MTSADVEVIRLSKKLAHYQLALANQKLIADRRAAERDSANARCVLLAAEVARLQARWKPRHR